MVHAYLSIACVRKECGAQESGERVSGEHSSHYAPKKESNYIKMTGAKQGDQLLETAKRNKTHKQH
jgi:hypothetical protein